MASHVTWPAYGCIHFFPRGKEVFEINTYVFTTKRLFYKARSCSLSELHGCGDYHLCQASRNIHTARDQGNRAPCSDSATSSIEKLLLLSPKMNFPLPPSKSQVHVDFSLEQLCHDNMSDGHVCPLTVVSALWCCRPEFRNTGSLKGALSRRMMNYKFCEMFDMTELFDWAFKLFPKLSSVICFIKQHLI